MKEKRKVKIIFTKPGGTASSGSVSSRLTLPNTWIRKMGIDMDNREVIISFDGKKISIEKYLPEKGDK